MFVYFPLNDMTVAAKALFVMNNKTQEMLYPKEFIRLPKRGEGHGRTKDEGS